MSDLPTSFDQLKLEIARREYQNRYLALLRAEEDKLFFEKVLPKLTDSETDKQFKARFEANLENSKLDIRDLTIHIEVLEEIISHIKP